jgi:hypothetical protein
MTTARAQATQKAQSAGLLARLAVGLVVILCLIACGLMSFLSPYSIEVQSVYGKF